MSMVEAQGLCKSYTGFQGQLEVLKGIDLNIDAGQSAALMGPSGSGKSTLLNILGVLEPPSSGQLRIDGESPYALPDRRIAQFRNATIGFVFQEHHLLPQCSVLENILVPTLAWGNVASPARSGADARARILLDRVGLAQRAEHRPGELSGGERQRAAIARALINTPRVVLADEPTGNLDRANAMTVSELLLELCRQQSVALLVATHSPALARHFDAGYELVDGRLVRS